MSEQRKDVRFDAGRAHRAQLGFVLLAMEQTVHEDMYTYAPDGVGVHFSRAPMSNNVTVDTLAAMADGLGPAAGLILPDLDIDVICYACTSGSVVIGEDRVCEKLLEGKPRAKPTSLITGVMRALKTLSARRIVVATPYLDEINCLESDYMNERGFDVLDIVGMNITRDQDMVRVTPEYIREFALSVDRADADAIFVSCGALRTIDVIEDIEAAAGKPVVSSNQAMLWDCLRLAGVNDHLPGLGRLFREH